MPTPPTDDERRQAACLAMGAAPGLLRFASRYTRSLHDAEDAYQRAMEIALTRAPVVEPRRYMAWLHTVLRNEALAVARARRREGPGAEGDVAETWSELMQDTVQVDALAEWRERYRSIQDGLAGLTDAQRTCLMLQAAGISYEDIRRLTGFTMRKVERSVLEGRRNLATWEVRLASGEACARLDETIGRVARGVASSKERRAVGRHVRHCGPCRATLRSRRDSNEWLGALVPVALIGGSTPLGVPDPTPAIAWWERVAGGATVRAGTVVQLALEMPSAALAKVGAGTAAVALAGAAGAPMVVDAVSPPPTPATAAVSATRVVDGAALTAAAAPTVDEVGAAFARARAAASRAAARARADERARRDDAPRRPPTRVAPRPEPAPEPTVVATAPDPPPAPTTPPATAAPAPAAVALEFGP